MKNMFFVFAFMLLFFIQSRSQQSQIITFPDDNLRLEILNEYGEGRYGVGNGAVDVPGMNDIDFTNLFTAAGSGPLSGISGVTSLNVPFGDSSNPSTQITDLTGVEKLVNLISLDIQNHAITQLPVNFGSLSALINLDLTSNKITSLPASFINLTALKALILNDNQLTVLPDLMGFPELQQLEVSDNQLTTLPAMPPKVALLIANTNKLTSLPAFLSPANGGLIINPDLTSNKLTFEDLEPLITNGVSEVGTGEYDRQATFAITPGSINLNSGQPLNLSVAGLVGGTNNQYQWYRDGIPVSDVSDSPIYVIASATPGNGGAYVCAVTNTLVWDLTISSDPVHVSVTPLPLLSSDRLWGMTSNGGVGNGSIFTMNGTSNAVQITRQLNSDDGEYPNGNLMLASDGFLYGMARLGGVNNQGTIFRINTDGTQFQKLYDFDSSVGGYPYGSLIQAADGFLYGMAERGPLDQLTGIIFKINTGSSITLNVLREFSLQEGLPSGNLMQAADGNLYGMTASDIIFKINTDGSGFSILYKLSDLTLDGHHPYGSLIQATNGDLYGMTANGGLNTQGDGGGTVFKISTDGSSFQKLFDMDHTTGDSPKGDLIQASNGDLYGMVQGGTYNFKGYIFKTDLRGSVFDVIYDFSDTNGDHGSNPLGNLIEAPNGELYGMTSGGGANDKGVIFKILPDGTGFTKVYDFDANGSFPLGSLLFLRNPVFVTGITVTGAGNAATINTVGGQLQMNAAILPATADLKAVTWSVTSITGSATIDDNGLLTAISDGTVTVKATATDGSGITGTKNITITGQAPAVLISGITVTTAGNATTINTIGGHLQMNAAVLPANASNPSVVWSLASGSAFATINSTGILTAVANGVVTVKAAANDGSNISGTKDITISGQSCIAPAKPTISVSFTNPDAPVLTSSSTTGNQWFLNGTAIGGAVQPSYIVAQAGTYTVQVKQSTCLSPASDGTAIVVTGVERDVTSGLYPNPVETELMYKTNNGSPLTLYVFDILGKPVKQFSYPAGGEVKIDVAGLPTGSYVLKASQQGNVQNLHFIKK